MAYDEEEAIKAKQVVEQKLQKGEYVASQRFAKKAQRLFPQLDNISQLLTICEVHCSAENKLFTGQMDWYKILQIEQLSGEAAIKKQYRKLALLLHPDKNKFPGAEAAFKLIGEATRVLSDPVSRSSYDIIYTAAVKLPRKRSFPENKVKQPVGPKGPKQQVITKYWSRVDKSQRASKVKTDEPLGSCKEKTDLSDTQCRENAKVDEQSNTAEKHGR